ncbi:MAG: hypothetical protein J3Q66DRAFT_421387 [Benniella sp.]|nr:MAG: hypothetical protein J3Q66DRAFT_421387 [Benniella sp.]
MASSSQTRTTKSPADPIVREEKNAEEVAASAAKSSTKPNPLTEKNTSEATTSASTSTSSSEPSVHAKKNAATATPSASSTSKAPMQPNVLAEKSPEKPKLEEDDDECAICLESMGQKTTTRQLACGHYFHSTCYTMWGSSCPVCRFDQHLVVQ